MASKSKKRRRVFRASCILAALIIAGSSFAWFTSKDEVTNRLSASGDYDVRIVESFAPPANWLPGQEVNKDVYAVNTGDVEAFVEETVSGALTVTREKATDGMTRPDTDCIELSPAEVYAIEAGSYLALVPENSNFEAGNKVVAMNPDFADENGYTSAGHGDFDPDAEGLYVFRRVIDYPDANHNGGNKQIETFEYDAYYFVPGMDAVTHKEQVQLVDPDDNTKLGWTKHDVSAGTDEVIYAAAKPDDTADFTYTAAYEEKDIVDNAAIPGKFYKVSNLDVTPDDTLDLAGDGVHTDGNLLAASAGFYKDVTETFDPTALKYEEAVTTGDNQHPKRLVVTYDLGTVDNLADLADKYDDALRAYEDAIAEYKAAVRDLNGTNGTNAALTTATNNLQDALDAMRAAENAKNAAEKLKAEKEKAMNEAQAALTAAQGAQADAQQAYNEAVAAYDAAVIAASQAQTARTNALDALGSDTQGADENGSAWEKYKYAQNAVNTFKTNNPTAYANFVAAFDAAVAADNTIDSSTTIDNVDYNTLDNMHLELNAGDDAYNYWKLVVAEKRAKEALDAAQQAYDLAAADAAIKTDQLAKAETAKNNAQDVLDAANGAVGNGSSGAQKAFADAQAAYNAAEAALGEESAPASNDSDASAWAKYNYAKNQLNSARSAYENALDDANADTTDLREAEKNYAKAAQALKNAEIAYDRAAAENDGKINIFVNLSDNVIITEPTADQNDKWQLLPASLVDTNSDTKADTARFYYTGILGGGETSTKLIDSVELDKEVTQDMFKYLDFDLNVDLKSAQIAMASDGETILTTATTTAGFDAGATLINDKNINTAVKWVGATPATPTSYTSEGALYKANSSTAEVEASVTITVNNPAVTINGVTYKYKIHHADKDFYADSLSATTVFNEYSTNGTTWTAGDGKITLANTATAS